MDGELTLKGVKNMNNLILTKSLQEKWLHNLLIFFSPLLILYISTVIGVISANSNGFHLQDLIPNTFAQGGLVLWILNSVLDYLRKLQK